MAGWLWSPGSSQSTLSWVMIAFTLNLSLRGTETRIALRRTSTTASFCAMRRRGLTRRRSRSCTSRSWSLSVSLPAAISPVITELEER
eukprot:scaffold1312_cov393-Prasinococcus_capsulatus_cf.AAC.18